MAHKELWRERQQQRNVESPYTKGKKCHVLIWLFNLFSILAAGSNPGSWTCPLLHPISKTLVFQ